MSGSAAKASAGARRMKASAPSQSARVLAVD